MKNRNAKNTALFIGIASALGLLCLSSGCGTTTNLAGLSASANFAQKGTVVGVTVTGGTNAVTVGATYQQGTNNIGGSVTVPTN